MGFSRSTTGGGRPGAGSLTCDMAGIGMNFAARQDPQAPIEETLVFASELGMDEQDLRVLAVLTTWMGVHHGRVNADRLARLLAEHPSNRVCAYWAAVAKWHSKDRRFGRLLSLHGVTPVELLPVGTDFQVSRRGEDERFVDSSLRVPAGTLRDRLADVLAPEALARRHPGYRNRVLMGPAWRADVWTVLEQEPELSVAEAARRVGCSFATAWQVVQDYKLLREAQPGPAVLAGVA